MWEDRRMRGAVHLFNALWLPMPARLEPCQGLSRIPAVQWNWNKVPAAADGTARAPDARSKTPRRSSVARCSSAHLSVRILTQWMPKDMFNSEDDGTVRSPTPIANAGAVTRFMRSVIVAPDIWLIFMSPIERRANPSEPDTNGAALP